jgi:hypothetical protein
MKVSTSLKNPVYAAILAGFLGIGSQFVSGQINKSQAILAAVGLVTAAVLPSPVSKKGEDK